MNVTSIGGNTMKITELLEREGYCSDKCCGADVKAADCTCGPDCPHCTCNAVKETFTAGSVASNSAAGFANGGIGTLSRAPGTKKKKRNKNMSN
jgi:hypothetical protein